MAARVTETICAEASRHRRIYAVDFFGTTIITTVTSTPSIIRRWLHTASYRLRRGFHPRIVGLGVQWEPYSDSDLAATLQMCVGEACLIVQLSHAPTVPMILRRFLLDPSYTFVGFWNHSDARRLAECRFGLEMDRPPLDLRFYSETQYGESLCQASVERIVEVYLGYEGVALEREISMSHWEDSVLSEEQVAQATVDAYTAFLIGDRVLIDGSVSYCSSPW